MGLADIPVEVVSAENEAHGDYTTNVALRLSKQLGKSPMAVAAEIKEKYHTLYKENQKVSTNNEQKLALQAIERIEVAAPGFINVFLSEAALGTYISEVIKGGERYGTGTSLFREAKNILVEFAHPNTHKAFHIGHLRNITTGEAVVRLLEACGHTVTRANYQGDVGMHIAKCLYALLHIPEIASQVEDVGSQDPHAKAEFLGRAYTAGSTAFEEDEEAKKKIGEINKKIYAKDAEVYDLYQKTREWSLEYFAQIYKRVGTHYDRYYFEGEVYEEGKALVLNGLKSGIFERSEGAVIFPGKKYGLHNRVFVTGEGNATYEAKEMGLGKLQFAEYNPDLVIHVVGPEQAGYFQVVFEALARMFPETKGKEYHLVYGWVKLKHGKMSSRSGNVVLGEWLLDEAKKEVQKIIDQNKTKYTKEQQNEITEAAAVAAVKYSFLKVSTTQEIAFDLAESVTFEGDSGPYLLYTHARAKSILRKAGELSLESDSSVLNVEERAVARLLMYFPEIVAEAAHALSPSLLCSYLFELAQAFNLFYHKHQILESKSRVRLTAAVAQVLLNGLTLLGIPVVNQM